VVDMSAPAVTARLTARLRTLGALSDMCRRLVEIGEPLRASSIKSSRGRG
jgi:hypothetical protein